MKNIENPVTYEDTLRYLSIAGIPDTDRVLALKLSRATEVAYAEGIQFGIREMKKAMLRAVYELRASNADRISLEADADAVYDDRMSEMIDASLGERSEELLTDVFEYGAEQYRKGYYSGLYDLITQSF